MRKRDGVRKVPRAELRLQCASLRHDGVLRLHEHRSGLPCREPLCSRMKNLKLRRREALSLESSPEEAQVAVASSSRIRARARSCEARVSLHR
jgi:hypothetical protein